MVPMHVKLLVQSNTTRQVLKEQQLLLCTFLVLQETATRTDAPELLPDLVLVINSRNLSTQARTA